MSEKKHIDRLFQEKFKDFEVFPNAGVWGKIEGKLKAKKSRKRILLPFWYKIAGSAAMLAFLVWMGNSIFDNAPQKNQNQTNIATEAVPNKDENPENKLEGTSVPDQVINDRKNGLTKEAVTSSQGIKKNPSGKSQLSAALHNDAFSKKAIAHQTNKPTPITPNSTPEEHFEKAFSNKSGGKKSLGEIPTEKTSPTGRQVSVENFEGKNKSHKKSLLAVAKEQEKKEFEETSDKKELILVGNKWQIQPFAAPIYYSGGNAIDPKFASNPTQSDVTMAYGINVAYQISDKIKVRTGIGQVNISNNVQDIAFASAVEPVALKNVNYNTQSEMLRIEGSSQFNEALTGEIAGRNIPFSAGTLNQQMGFIEVPLEIEYAIIDKKFGLSLIGGGSTLFLNQNNISIISAQGNTNIGKANNLNKTSFSTNIGLGLDYEILQHFELSLEPTFKYQLNTFNKTVDFDPYYFGVFTGVSFNF